MDQSNIDSHLLGKCDAPFKYPKYDFINGYLYSDDTRKNMIRHEKETFFIILKLRHINDLAQILEILACVRDMKYVKALMEYFNYNSRRIPVGFCKEIPGV